MGSIIFFFSAAWSNHFCWRMFNAYERHSQHGQVVCRGRKVTKQKPSLWNADVYEGHHMFSRYVSWYNIAHTGVPLSNWGEGSLWSINMNNTTIYSLLAIIFLACVPSLNPFLNLRVKVFMYLIRPVPTVLLPLAFCPQLKFLIFLAGYPHEEHVFFWMW